MTSLIRLAVACALVSALQPSRAEAQATAPAAPPAQPATETPPKLDVPYVPTPQAVVDEMLKLAKPTNSDLLYDLGCGDGRIVVTAAKLFGTKGVGFDIDPARIRDSEANAQSAGVTGLATFRKQDLFTVSLAEPSVLTMYLLPSVNMKLRPKIFAETKPGTRIVSHAFTMEDWQPDQRSSANGANIYFWVVPANLTGTWKASGLGKEPTTLRFDQQFQKAQGAVVAAAGTERPLSDVVVNGSEVTFTADLGGGTPVRCRGRVIGDRVEGTVEGTVEGGAGSKWSATRDPATKQSLDPTAAAVPTAAIR
jgi:precorrin-6B methylase 2